MKKNRSTLKDYFKKGAIPTEANFADLIDSMLNQEEDSISKLPNDPLKITAVGVDEALVNFYRIENNAEKLSWQVKQKPGGVAGLSISDATAASRLFIENTTGNIGIGTTTPGSNKLRVEGGAISTNGNLHTQRGRLAFSNAADDVNHTIYNNNNNIDAEGAWDGMKMNVYAGLDVRIGNASTKKQVSALYIDGSGNLGIGITKPLAKLHVSGGQIQLDGNQKISFSDADTTNNLKLQLWSGYGLGINPGTMFYAADGKHSWRDSSGTNERMLLTTGADGGLTVKGTGTSSFAGSLSVGSLQFKGFTGNDIDEWPNVVWYRDTAANWDEGLIKGGSSRGRFGKAGFGIHFHQSRQFGLFSTGWDSLLVVEGGTGNTFIKGYVSAKQVYFSAYVDLNSRTGNLNPLPMQVASQNVGGGYDTGTSTFTAPVKGVYLFTMNGYKAEDAGVLSWFLMVNGNNANAGGTNSTESDERTVMTMNAVGTTSSRTMMVALNAGDKVTVKQAGSGRVDNFRSGLEGILLFASF